MIILMMIELKLMKLLTVKKRKVNDVRVGRNGVFLLLSDAEDTVNTTTILMMCMEHMKFSIIIYEVE